MFLRPGTQQTQAFTEPTNITTEARSMFLYSAVLHMERPERRARSGGNIDIS